MVKVSKPKMLSVDLLRANEWNPNEQSEETFQQLMQEIKEDGFEQPLNVVKDDKGKGYVIIGGEHRWRAACLLGMEELPCYVHDWDMSEQKLKTVRRNLLTGKLNARKFTDLVDELTQTGLELNDMPTALGFDTQKEFDRYFIKAKEAQDTEFVDDLTSEKAPMEAQESLMSIVANIFNECKGAATVDQSYLFFTVKGKVQMAILCSDQTWDAVQNLVAHLRESGESADAFIREVIQEKLS